jgi:hypothetical protein
VRTAGFSAVGVLGTGFTIWAKNLPTLLLLMLLVYSPLLIYKGVKLSGEQPFLDRVTIWGELLATLLLGLLATSAVLYVVFRGLRGERASVLGCLRTVLVRILPAIGAALLLVVAVALPLGIAVLLAARHPIAGPLGALFCIYVYCTLWMMIPVVVVESVSPFAAFKRSVVLTHGKKLHIFLVLFVVGVILLGAWFVIGKETAGDTRVVLEIASMLVLGALEATLRAVSYHDLRQAREGIGVDELLKVFA